MADRYLVFLPSCAFRDRFCFENQKISALSSLSRLSQDEPKKYSFSFRNGCALTEGAAVGSLFLLRRSHRDLFNVAGTVADALRGGWIFDMACFFAFRMALA